MAILKILQYPDLRLRRQGYRVGNPQAAKIQKTIADMIETLHQQENCAGLAATQLDIENPPHITVINNIARPFAQNILCLINLQIIEADGAELDNEGCMSVFPQHIYAKITRATKIKVRALDAGGNQMEFIAKDFLARCIQHEYDHLQGILYIDHLPQAERLVLDKKITKLAAK